MISAFWKIGCIYFAFRILVWWVRKVSVSLHRKD